MCAHTIVGSDAEGVIVVPQSGRSVGRVDVILELIRRGGIICPSTKKCKSESQNQLGTYSKGAKEADP